MTIPLNDTGGVTRDVEVQPSWHVTVLVTSVALASTPGNPNGADYSNVK